MLACVEDYSDSVFLEDITSPRSSDEDSGDDVVSIVLCDDADHSVLLALQQTLIIIAPLG